MSYTCNTQHWWVSSIFWCWNSTPFCIHFLKLHVPCIQVIQKERVYNVICFKKFHDKWRKWHISTQLFFHWWNLVTWSHLHRRVSRDYSACKDSLFLLKFHTIAGARRHLCHSQIEENSHSAHSVLFWVLKSHSSCLHSVNKTCLIVYRKEGLCS